MIPICLVFNETLAVFNSVFIHHLHSHQDGGRTPFFVLSLKYLFFADLFHDGHCDQCEVILHCSLIGIDLIITDVKYVSMYFCYFTPCEYNLPLESAFLKVGPVWNSFPITYPKTFLEGGCLFTALSDLWLLRSLQHIFYGMYIYLNQLISLCPLQLSSLVTVSFFFKSLRLILL